MARISRLTAKFPLQYNTDVFGILHTPAPRLGLLDVYVPDDTTGSTAFPIDLFTDHAPKLTCLRLFNVCLTPPYLPNSIFRLESLQYYASNEQTFPTAFLSHCTSLKNLSIFGRYSPVTPVTQHAYACVHRPLEALEVGVFLGSLHILQPFPCASIAHVAIPLNRKAAAHLLLGHLRGALHLRAEQSHDVSFFEYASAAGLRRTFIHARLDIASLAIPETYTTDDLFSRVKSVAVSADCIPLLAALRALPACEKIAVSAATGHPLAPLKAAVVLPRLETLELECEPGYSVDDARTLFDAMMAHAKSPVRFCLTDGRGQRELGIAPPCESCA